MNKPNNMKNRQRGRNNNGKPRPMGGGGGRNPNFDGGQRMRGNAQQLMEKYLALARDASSSGDRVLAENYFQHADHYYRVLNARFEQQQQNNGNRQNYNQNGGNNGQNYNQGNYNQGGFDGDQQPNFNEHQGQQPHHGNHQQQPYQHQPQYQPQHQPQYQHQPAQPEPAHEQPRASQGQSEEIGLPPGILGMNPAQAAPAGESRPQSQTREGGDEERGRQGGRRRRGRGDRSGAADAE